MIRIVSIFISAFGLLYLFAPLGGNNNIQILNISTATAAEFADAGARADAMKKVNAKKVPGDYCSSLAGNKEAFQIFCGTDMLPLKRRFCEKKYKQIMAENTCRDPYAPQAMMTAVEKCDALKDGYNFMCGANKDPLDAADCATTAELMKKNKCN